MSTLKKDGMNCKKIALVGPPMWALWNINFFLKKHFEEKGYEARIVEWNDWEQIRSGIDWCDVFITEVSAFNTFGPEERKKGLFCWHHLANIDTIPLSEEQPCRHFTTLIDVDKDYEDQFFAINPTIIESVKEYYGIEPTLLPIGCDKDFWHKREVSEIKTIGHISHPSPGVEYDTIKRLDMFWELVDFSDYEGKQVHGKSMLCGSYIYKDVDAVVNTSTHEGLPTPLLECSMAKIPFISTEVGIVPTIKSIRTFSTIEEAKEILDDLNSSPEKLKKYVDDVYNEVMEKNEWGMLIDKYYIPAVERVISKIKKKASKEVVVSHYQENLSWIDQLHHQSVVTIYSKSEKDIEREHIKLPNEGMIEHTIFHHLATRYDNLADFTFFCQDHPFDHVPHFIDSVNNFDPESDNGALRHKDGYWGFYSHPNVPEPRYNDWDGYPDYPDRNLKVDEVWDELFETEKPERLTFVPAAHPCVSREHAHIRSKEFYQKVRDMAKNREWGPWEIERITWAIFDKDIVAKC